MNAQIEKLNRINAEAEAIANSIDVSDEESEYLYNRLYNMASELSLVIAQLNGTEKPPAASKALKPGCLSQNPGCTCNPCVDPDIVLLMMEKESERSAELSDLENTLRCLNDELNYETNSLSRRDIKGQIADVESMIGQKKQSEK
jgi:hypothetical protein